jgi:hypothetical protein
MRSDNITSPSVDTLSVLVWLMTPEPYESFQDAGLPAYPTPGTTLVAASNELYSQLEGKDAAQQVCQFHEPNNMLRCLMYL